MNSPAQYFRAGVGAVIVNGRGLVLAMERADVPGAWQLPQGGLENSEEPLPAALREIAEETCISQRNLELLDTYPEPLAYELPVHARSAKTGRGQVQYWFLFRFHGNDKEITVAASGEVRSWKWMSLFDLMNSAVDFRKPIYRKLANRFVDHLARPDNAGTNDRGSSGSS